MDWRELEEMVDQTISDHFDEQVRISFFLPNGTADPARPQWTGRAVLHSGGDDSYQAGTGYRTRLSAGQAELVLGRSTYDGPVIRAKDRVRALDRAGTPIWEVKDISDRYSHLIVASLTQA